MAALTDGSPVAYRLPSLLATAVAGFALYRFALRLLPAGGAWLAAALFLAAPLQYYGVLAIPNALMVAFGVLGVGLVWWGESRLRLAAGAACLVLAVLYKPLMLSTLAAVGGALLLSRDRRWKLAWVAGSGGAAGLLAWAVLHALSDGMFTEVLGAQLFRYAKGTGFDVFSGFEPFVAEVARRGVDSALEWNLSVHAHALLSPRLRHANAVLVALAAVGQIALWTRWGRRFSGSRMLLTLWWLVPLAAHLGFWVPNWNHYFLQYLPPLALLGALGLTALWSAAAGRRWARAGVAATALAALALGPASLRAYRMDYANLARPRAPGERWLTFDPFLNLMTGTEPACGLIDPFNVYGEDSLILGLLGGAAPASEAAPSWAAYYVAPEDLIACLERDRDIVIALGYWALWFVDEELERYVEDQPPQRVVRLRLRDL